MKKGKFIGVLLIIVLVALGGYFLLRQNPVSVQQPNSSTPSNQNSSPQRALLPAPNVTLYQGGFAKIEIPLNRSVSDLNTDRSGIFNTAKAAESGQIYEVYRSSSGTNGNPVKIATVESSPATDYLAVFDTNYPRDSQSLSYQYASVGANISYSATSTVDLQQAVDEGHQPWRLSPLLAAEATSGVSPSGIASACDQSGNREAPTPCDIFTLTSQAASAGTAEVQAKHDGKTYLIELVQPIPGEGKIWMVSKVNEKI